MGRFSFRAGFAFVNFSGMSRIDHMSGAGHAKLGRSPHGPWLLSVMRTPPALAPLPRMEWSSAIQRRRFEQAASLEERLAEQTQRLREEANSLPPGIAREQAIRKTRQAETGAHISEWLSSPGLQSPK
jgi:hypothetical protein